MAKDLTDEIVQDETDESTDNQVDSTEEVQNSESIDADAQEDEVSDDVEVDESTDEEQDDKKKTLDKPSKEPKNFKEKIKELFEKWWNNKKLRYSTFAGIGVLIVLSILIPVSRYFILNTFGVRAKTSITVYDESSKFPLKNVQVSISGKTVKTDQKGLAKLENIKLGKQKLTISKRAFAEVSKNVTIGWGSNPLGKTDIKPVGAQYTFYLTDWLSGKPVSLGQATSGDYDAGADKDGKILLTIEPSDDEDLDVNISSNGYRTEKIKLDLSNKAKIDVKLVSKRKHPFISRRSGTYDLYKIDVDGKNENLVLKGSGLENSSMNILSHPTDEVTSVTSTREEVRNSDGYLLNSLYIVDLEDNSSERIAQAEAIKTYGWSNDKLIYTLTVAGTSAANPKRNRLFSYDYKTKSKKELASANNFNDILLIGSNVYYAPGNSYVGNGSSNFSRINADGSNQVNILNKEVWNIFRSSYDDFDLSVANQEWYNYKTSDDKAFISSSPPTNFVNKDFIDNPSFKKSLWTEDRDGQGTLILYDIPKKDDKVLKQQAGLKYAVRWLDDTKLVYRIQTSNETADYVLNIDGGDAVKIRDVTQSTPVY